MPGRGNGLRAPSYAPLVDLDPRLADAMLEALRAAGVAAYAVPVGSEASAQLIPRPASGPKDRLYVDAEADDVAAHVLRSHLPDEFGEDRREERAWKEIVAGFDTDPTDPVPRWPVAEDLDSEATVRAGTTDTERRQPDETTVDDSDDHFVPPPPPPVPRPDPLTVAGWMALFGGPAYLLVATMLDWTTPGWLAFAAVGAFVGGFVLLVLRLGEDRDGNGDEDDGAVV